jgi:hypothetical protein
MTPPFPYGGSVDLGSSLDAEEQTAMHDALHHCADHCSCEWGASGEYAAARRAAAGR